MYATQPRAGRVVTLPDADKDGVADSVKTFADGLDGVQGIAFKDDAVYVATESEIERLEDANGDGVADKRDELASDLPSGGGHSTRTIAFSADGTKLFVSAGSSCNVCKWTTRKRRRSRSIRRTASSRRCTRRAAQRCGVAGSARHGRAVGDQ